MKSENKSYNTFIKRNNIMLKSINLENVFLQKNWLKVRDFIKHKKTKNYTTIKQVYIIYKLHVHSIYIGNIISFIMFCLLKTHL